MPVTGKSSDQSSVMHEELRDKVEELEGNLYGLAAQVQSQVDHRGRVATLRLMDQQQEKHHVRSLEHLELALQALETRLERSLAEVAQKLNVMQDAEDEQQVALRHLAQQLPEVSKRLDQLWAQCQLYFPRLQEQEVHFGFLRASFEAHKQQMLDLTEGLERKSLTRGCFFEVSCRAGVKSARRPTSAPLLQLRTQSESNSPFRFSRGDCCLFLLIYQNILAIFGSIQILP
eukprot:s5_g43.t2